MKHDGSDSINSGHDPRKWDIVVVENNAVSRECSVGVSVFEISLIFNFLIPSYSGCRSGYTYVLFRVARYLVLSVRPEKSTIWEPFRLETRELKEGACFPEMCWEVTTLSRLLGIITSFMVEFHRKALNGSFSKNSQTSLISGSFKNTIDLLSVLSA